LFEHFGSTLQQLLSDVLGGAQNRRSHDDHGAARAGGNIVGRDIGIELRDGNLLKRQ